jgi:uncharacterized protein YodC (DUF2158 family)
MMDKFKVGDLVRTKGIQGPVMVVTLVKENEVYMCMWFDKENHMSVIEFPEALIETTGKTPGQALN